MYPDAGGVRPAFHEMAARLAGLGYVVLLPDVYYRSGSWVPFDMKTASGDEEEGCNRLFGLMRSVTPEVRWRPTPGRSSTIWRPVRRCAVSGSGRPVTAWADGRR